MRKNKFLFWVMDHLNHTSIQKNLDFVMKSQWWGKGEIENYQNEKFRKLVKHCYENVHFYTKYFKKNKLHYSDFKTLNDIYKLPILRKRNIKEKHKEFLASNSSIFKPVFKRTGGSTGETLNYYNDLNVRSLQWALKFRSWGWGGYNFGDKIGILGGSSLFPKSSFSIKRLIWKKLNNFYPMSVVHFNDELGDKYANVIAKHNIKYLRGYPSSISDFADYIRKSKTSIYIKSVFPTAEVLLDPHRENIKDFLHSEVFDQYGCADAGAHASECEMHDGLHIHPEIVFTEIIDESQNNIYSGSGELIFTNLLNYSFPLLRYAPEDLGEISNEDCGCGRKSFKLKKIIGRTTDRIKLINGRIIGGPALTLIFSRLNISKYQVIQKASDYCIVNFHPDSAFTFKDLGQLKMVFHHHFGKEIKFEFNETTNFYYPQSGKFRFIISEIDKR